MRCYVGARLKVRINACCLSRCISLGVAHAGLSFQRNRDGMTYSARDGETYPAGGGDTESAVTQAAENEEHHQPIMAEAYPWYMSQPSPWAAYFSSFPAAAYAAYPPAPYFHQPYIAAGPSSSSFAQSMPPPAALPFTMGSAPREPAWGARRTQVAAIAMHPPRHRGRRHIRRG